MNLPKDKVFFPNHPWQLSPTLLQLVIALHAIHNVLVLSDGRQIAYGGRDEVLKKVTRQTQQPAQPPSGETQLAQKQLEAVGPQPRVPETRN